MEYFTFVYVKKTAGSMGIVMVDGDMSGFAIAFVPIIIYTHMISLNKIKKHIFIFHKTCSAIKTLKITIRLASNRHQVFITKSIYCWNEHLSRTDNY
jgi:hypothetical protein